MKMILDVPDAIAADFGCDEVSVSRRLQAGLAVLFYQQRTVSLGRAAELSGLPRWEFEELVAAHGVERDYVAADLAEDIAWAGRAS